MRSIDEVPTAADFGFPSPAAEDILITTPSLDRTLLAAAVSSPSWSTDSIVEGRDALLLASEPDVVRHQVVVTPGQEMQPPLSFDAIVGADVDPAPSDALSLPPNSKAGPALRLPSFMSLGIANPTPDQHPAPDHVARDDLSQHPLQSLGLDIGASHDPFSSDDLREQVDILRQEVDSPGSHSFDPSLPSPPLQQFVTTLTPPDENGRITWESITKLSTGPMNSPTTESEVALTSAEESVPSTLAASGGTAAPSDVNNITSAFTVPVRTLTNEVGVALGDIDDAAHRIRPAWLNPVISAMLNNVNMAERTSPIKVLSHALPTPSMDGHVFPTIIHSLQDETPTSPMCWINVFHALPGKFNLADLPRSPPSTPGPPVGGDDYFTSKTFDTAVRVCDYNSSLASLPQSPSPIVPPSSVDVSIVERYIPPSSLNEFSEMFNVKGPSILVDRLVELSPDNGTLIFIYPTKKGAKTFTTDYLGPVLEPLLRTIVVVNGFSADMGSSAGKMVAAAALPDHDVMRLRIQNLCATLSQTSPRMEKFHRKQATFSVIYASKEEVKLDRAVWAESWWCKQEKPRLRETVNRYFRKANRASEEKTPPMIIQELLDGVASNPYRNGEPTSAIEISAFIIKRSG